MDKVSMESITIDLHRLTTWQAMVCLDRVINSLPAYTRTIEIIHGYQNGQAIKEMIGIEYTNRKISGYYHPKNQGRTYLIVSHH